VTLKTEVTAELRSVPDVVDEYHDADAMENVRKITPRGRHVPAARIRAAPRTPHEVENAQRGGIAPLKVIQIATQQCRLSRNDQMARSRRQLAGPGCCDKDPTARHQEHQVIVFVMKTARSSMRASCLSAASRRVGCRRLALSSRSLLRLASDRRRAGAQCSRPHPLNERGYRLSQAALNSSFAHVRTDGRPA